MSIIETELKVKASTSGSTDITAPMADPERVTDLLNALRDKGISLAEISVQEPTLDEVFMVLTGETKLVEKGAT
jgi:ABC-2 type transport system ATP-binding protein